MLVLCIAVYLDFGTHATVPLAYYYPLILVSILLLILFCPLPIANWGARKWFLLSIGRLLISGYYSVEFRDFFLADEMNSLSYSIEQFEFAICAYANGWKNLECSTGQMWITPFVTALPPWFRFLQCLRRFRDTQQWFPHLVNCGKYTASLATIFIYFSYRHYGGYRLKAAYIVISIITSIYTFTWDVYMDWGLFRFGKYGGGAYGRPFLRPELVYSWEWAYYVAIVLDFLGRFSWILRVVSLDVNPLILSFSLALIEVLRRWMWNFFRLENEHLNNCGQFRAIKDIPLPFHIHVESDSESEVEDN
ncbi:MAG: EXS family-domain-containing protein, partial [Benniella sp.]